MKSPRNLYSKIATIFMIITVAVMAIILHVTLATATINLPQKVDKFTLEAPVEISKTVTPDGLYGETTSIDLEKTQSFPVSGKLVTTDKAGVTVTITNSTARPQALVKTTRFLSADNKLFRLTESVTVPANGQISGFLEADKAGKDYDIPATHFTIPGLAVSLQDKIFGQSDKPSSYEKPEGLSLSQADIDEARKSLVESMKTEAATELQKKISSATQLSADQISVTVISETTSPKIGTKTQQFSYTLKATFTTMIFDRDGLLGIANDRLKQKLPTDATLLKVDDKSFSYKIDEFSTSTDSATAHVHLEASIASGSTLGDFINLQNLAGKTKEQALQYLQDQGVKGVTITLSPFWVWHIPRLTDHIHVEALPSDQAE